MESWADHTAWISSTDRKSDKKQQMGHVFTKTTLQDTGLLCSNETVVPSCHTLARTLAILWIEECHAWLEKQQANSCRQIHTQKTAQKGKQQHRPNNPTPWREPGTPPSKPLRQWGGEEESRGSKLPLGSWHSTWPPASFSLPASQTWLSWWVPRAGGRRIPPGPPSGSPESTCRAQRQLQLDTPTCLKKPKGQLGLLAELHSSGPAAQVALLNSDLKLHLFFFQGCVACFAARAEHSAPCSWAAEAIQSYARLCYLQNANAAHAT